MHANIHVCVCIVRAICAGRKRGVWLLCMHTCMQYMHNGHTCTLYACTCLYMWECMCVCVSVCLCL